MKTKPFWQSTTIWFNILSLIVVLYTQYQALIPARYAELAAGVIALINIIIRMGTNSKLTMSKEDA